MQYYNGQYGFDVGNKLPCLVAETLKSTFRDVDAFVQNVQQEQLS